jgi:hypothetical protein
MRKFLIAMLMLSMLLVSVAAAREVTVLKTDLTPPVIADDALAACVVGNNNSAGILGYYDTWFGGFENYAIPINAGDSGCTCGEGVTITTIHMMLALDNLANLDVAVAVLDAENDGAGCLSPGVEFTVSPVYNVSGLTGGLAYYDIALPIDGPCATVGDAQFLAVYFLNDNDSQFFGIPISAPANNCTNYNNWGDGYVDLVADYGFAGDILV